MKIGVIGAMEAEIASLVSKMEINEEKTFAGMTFFSGTVGGTDTVAVRSGVGKVSAAVCAQILIDRFDVTHIINSGIAGSLNNDINIGDVVVSTDAVQHDFHAEVFGYAPGQNPSLKTVAFEADEKLRKAVLEAIRVTAPEINVFEGRVASGDQFICQKEVKHQIRDTFHALCTEMEGAAIAQTAWLNDIPFLIVRYISDKADEESTIPYSDFEEQAAKHSADLIYRVLKHYQ